MPDMNESLRLWDRYGQFVLMATAYQDRVLVKARGSRIIDADGNVLIDLEAGQICSILGHNHPELIRRVVAQTEELLHHGTGFLSTPVLEASAKMAEVTPEGLKKTIFLSTGAEANECAFRIAKLFTGKRGIVGFDRGYAGLTLATIAVGGSSRDASFAVPGAVKILAPHCAQCPLTTEFPACEVSCLSVSGKFIEAHCGDDVAAFVVEPILSSGGMIVPPPGYFRHLRALADHLGALIIADEAQTGMARTGTWFGMEADGVTPDILVFSKGAGGGFPAAGVTVTEEIADNILGEFGNFSSHQSDPVAAVAVSAVIDIIRKEDLIAHAKRAGDRLMDGMRGLSAKYGVLGNVRGRGLMIGVDSQEIPDLGLSRGEVGVQFENMCREGGVHLKSIHGGTIFRILPPLNICDDDIDESLHVFDEVSAAILDGKGKHVSVGSRNPHTRRLEKARGQQSMLRRVARKAWETSPAGLYERLTRLVDRGSGE